MGKQEIYIFFFWNIHIFNLTFFLFFFKEDEWGRNGFLRINMDIDIKHFVKNSYFFSVILTSKNSITYQ